MPSAFVQVTDLKCVSELGYLRSTAEVRKGCWGLTQYKSIEVRDKRSA